MNNDYPERCFNTGMSQNGIYTKRSGYSCLYNKAITPSCVHCQLQRTEITLNDSVNVALEPCKVCSDWWAKDEHRSIYPIPPGGDLTKVGNVELTFDLISNSLQDLRFGTEKTNGKRGHQHIQQNT